MHPPVDLADLHSMTGNDAAVEQTFFQLFFESSAECLKAMQFSLQDDAPNIWRRKAHTLKGTSLNLGAERLGQLCLEAQENYQASLEKKQQLFAAIQVELKHVEQYLSETQSTMP